MNLASHAHGHQRLLLFALASLLAASGAAGGCATENQEARPSEATFDRAATEARGSVPSGNFEAGKEIFAQRCAKCHSLGRGRASDVGVNLRELRPSFEVVVEAVERGGIAMPSFGRRLSDDDIRDVATYVAESVR
jgi:mono/diheme cytochrome c family protein